MDKLAQMLHVTDRHLAINGDRYLAIDMVAPLSQGGTDAGRSFRNDPLCRCLFAGNRMR